MKRTAAIPGALALACLVGCDSPPAERLVSPLDPSNASVWVDNSNLLVPPPGYPVLDDAYVTVQGRGKSKIKRSSDGATGTLKVKDQTPGNVLVYATIIFNYPEYCVEGEDRLPEWGPCRANGPADPRDGGIPEVQLSADAWQYRIVGDNGMATFEVDLTNDRPTWSSDRNGAPGLSNPEGAVIAVYIQDKGPLAPEGPLRAAQVNTLFGGCQGPPAFGPLPCRGAALVQHLPPS